MSLPPESWAQVIELIALLYAFQVDDAQVEILRSTPLSSFVGAGYADSPFGETDARRPTIAAVGGADVTSASTIDPIMPIARCARPSKSHDIDRIAWLMRPFSFCRTPGK